MLRELRTIEQRQHGFLNDYEKLCHEHGMYLDGHGVVAEPPSPRLLELNLAVIRMRTEQRRRQIEHGKKHD